MRKETTKNMANVIRYLESSIMKVYLGSVKKKLKNRTNMIAEMKPNK
jgi:hypothetical protein